MHQAKCLMKLSPACAKIEKARGARMRALIRMLAAAVALAMSTGTALAAMGKTNTDVALRAAPAAQAELILNLSEGTLVNVGRCSRGWCRVTWNNYGGYVRQSALQFQSTPASGPPAIPVFPPYPYKAGHYPTADAYYDLPPYAATNPSFYRWRHFLTAQERNRYRYMPYIFRSPSGYLESWPTVSSSETPEPASEPMSPKSSPTVEPSPAGPAEVLEPKVKKEDTAPSPPAPDRPPRTPEPSPPAPEAPLGAAPEGLPAPGLSPPTPEIRPPLGTPAPEEPPGAGPSPQAPKVPEGPLGAPGPSPQAPERPLGVTVTELRDVTKGWSVKRTILGQPVYNEKDERVGSVDDIIVTDKAVSYGIVNAGGFLGLTKHNVAIPVSQFKLVDNKFVLPGVSKESLKASPDLRDVTKGWSVKRTILGQPVYNEKDERVGSVDDIIVTPDKAVSYGIVNAGGFLGLAKHNVAIPVSQFKLVDNKLVLPGATKEALKASPEFRYAQ
jgi:sporulation protein YlmC with PRC-barrel domain